MSLSNVLMSPELQFSHWSSADTNNSDIHICCEQSNDIHKQHIWRIEALYKS